MCGKIVFGLLLLISSAQCYGLILNQYEATILEQFFRTMVLESEGGYVLRDSKPVCIHGYHVVDSFYGESKDHRDSVILREGAILWKNLVPKDSGKDVVVHIYNHQDSLARNHIHILFINKPLLFETVTSNLPLFQYVLGPWITPAELLRKLTDPNDSFHSVLKRDKVLIGILLGFGTQNSLFGSYFELLQENLLMNERVPQKNLLLQSEALHPSWIKEALLYHVNSISKNTERAKIDLPFVRLNEELNNIKKHMTISSEQLSENRPRFIFGRLKEDEQTDILVQKLESVQQDIIKMVSQEDFLQVMLESTLNEERIEIADKNSRTAIFPNFSADELKVLPILVAISIFHSQLGENEAFVQGYIQGMKDADKGLENKFKAQQEIDYQRLKIFAIAQENIRDANLYFSNLAQQENLHCICPSRLYYRLIEEGSGGLLNSQKDVTIHCRVEAPTSIIANTWAAEEPLRMNLKEMIPGFSWGMQGMKEGETRELFIHPYLGYGIYTLLDKGVHLKAQVKLIAIHETQNAPSFEKPTEYNFDDDLAPLGRCNFEEVSEIAGYRRGYNVWSHYKQGDFYSLKQVLGWLEEEESLDTGIDYASEKHQNLLNRLHWVIYNSSLLASKI